MLINTGPNLALPAEQLGNYIRQRFAGEPAVSLAKPLIARKAGILNTLRSFCAYWITLFTAGTFVFGSVLSVQGLAQLLPRQVFLRVSSFLQIGFFCLVLLVYFLQPPFAGLDILVDNQNLLSWLPSYWFLSIFQQLNGALPSMLGPFAQRAWIGLAMSVAGTVLAYAICYFRTLRKIAEQPDILPAIRGLHWLPGFGNSLETAVGQFAVRTLFRSRHHRVILTFYIGTALGLAFFISNAPFLGGHRSAGADWYQASATLLVSSFLLMCGAVIGVRAVFSMPLELRANWIFRVAPTPDPLDCLAASRRTLYGLAVAPVIAIMAVLFFWSWPWRPAVGHLIILGLVGMIIGELLRARFHKIPFTCSYVPGRSYFHMAALAFLGIVFRLNKGAALERTALDYPARFVTAVIVLVIVVGALGWRNSARAKSEEAAVQFEDELETAILGLGLNRDGVASMKV